MREEGARRHQRLDVGQEDSGNARVAMREMSIADATAVKLSGPCARDHHAKHAPGWTLRQIEPGVLKWTTPSGRSYTTRPTRYDI
jgi:hypothetical protein